MRAIWLWTGLLGLVVGAGLTAAASTWLAFAPSTAGIRSGHRLVPAVTRAELGRLSSDPLAVRLFGQSPIGPVLADDRNMESLDAHGGGFIQFFHRPEPVG